MIRLQTMKPSKGAILAAVIAMEGAVGYLDYAGEGDVPLANLHFIPIVLAALYFGYAGAVGAALSSIAVFHLTHFYLPGNAVYLPEADLVRLALFVLIGLITARLADDRQRLRECARAADKRSAELALANAELAKVSAEKSRVVAIASHEVRAPLTVIMGHTQLLQRDEGLDPGHRQRLQRVVSAAQQLLHTLNNILDHSAIEAGRLRLDRRPVDVIALAEECVKLYGDLWQRYPISLVAPAGQMIALVDREKIGRVLVNLLSNAAKYSPPDRPITIRIAAETETISLEVADEGPGIAAAERRRIFDAYYRSNGAGNGVGLGLAICNEIVSAHGGQIGVRAGAPTGSVFYFTLPASPANHADRASEATTAVLVAGPS